MIENGGGTDPDGLGWELIGWETDDLAAHETLLTREEMLRVRDLFPRGDDELLLAGVYDVPVELYADLRAAVPRLEFRAGLAYQLGGFRFSA